MTTRLSRSDRRAIGVTALAIVAMFFDHMLDVEEPFPGDWPAFAISVALILIVGAMSSFSGSWHRWGSDS